MVSVQGPQDLVREARLELESTMSSITLPYPQTWERGPQSAQSYSPADAYRDIREGYAMTLGTPPPGANVSGVAGMPPHTSLSPQEAFSLNFNIVEAAIVVMCSQHTKDFLADGITHQDLQKNELRKWRMKFNIIPLHEAKEMAQYAAVEVIQAQNYAREAVIGKYGIGVTEDLEFMLTRTGQIMFDNKLIAMAEATVVSTFRVCLNTLMNAGMWHMTPGRDGLKTGARDLPWFKSFPRLWNLSRSIRQFADSFTLITQRMTQLGGESVAPNALMMPDTLVSVLQDIQLAWPVGNLQAEGAPDFRNAVVEHFVRVFRTTDPLSSNATIIRLMSSNIRYYHAMQMNRVTPPLRRRYVTVLHYAVPKDATSISIVSGDNWSREYTFGDILRLAVGDGAAGNGVDVGALDQTRIQAAAALPTQAAAGAAGSAGMNDGARVVLNTHTLYLLRWEAVDMDAYIAFKNQTALVLGEWKKLITGEVNAFTQVFDLTLTFHQGAMVPDLKTVATNPFSIVASRPNGIETKFPTGFGTATPPNNGQAKNSPFAWTGPKNNLNPEKKLHTYDHNMAACLVEGEIFSFLPLAGRYLEYLGNKLVTGKSDLTWNSAAANTVDRIVDMTPFLTRFHGSTPNFNGTSKTDFQRTLPFVGNEQFTASTAFPDCFRYKKAGAADWHWHCPMHALYAPSCLGDDDNKQMASYLEVRTRTAVV